MERFLMKKMEIWLKKERRKPLIIYGARQVGKTWLMKEFGKRYFSNTIYINFENNPRMKRSFSQDFDLKRIIEDLKVESGRNFSAEDTLLIFDEVQEVPEALTCLKYFCENAPEYHIVAAGSLLGIALHAGTSFPVGKVDILRLYPLSFREFLLAVGEERLCEALTDCKFDTWQVFSDRYITYLRSYYFVGGMPEAVSQYLADGDHDAVREIQRNILQYYETDFSKHAPKEVIPRIRMVWDSLPAQLAKENKKFIYGIIREGARAKDYELAIEWLKDYGLIYKSYRVKKPGLPLSAYMEQSVFKMFMLDVGLLAAKSRLSKKVLLEGSRIFEEFKGGLTESFIAQELMVSGEELYYYSTENSSGEIDFVLQSETGIVPLEVKAEENLRARSLRAFCDKYKPESAIRSSMSDFREQDWMTNVPLYALAAYWEKYAEGWRNKK